MHLKITQYDTITIVLKHTQANLAVSRWWLTYQGEAILPYKVLCEVLSTANYYLHI